jgi:2-polyprenyl-6-methoxyphenol hydroxylase-like FAD-dependent oxidoreductase
MDTLEAEVLISGAGPAGLSLAMELGSRGVSCLLIEPQLSVNDHPRASLLGPRSMEYFRRHGLADAILQAGLPTHLPYEIRFAVELAGPVLYHTQTVPSQESINEMHRGTRPATPEASNSPCSRVQIGQDALEPVLRDYLSTLASVRVMYGWEVRECMQDEEGVTAVIGSVGADQSARVRARYLAACDGARSPIRRSLGIQYLGRGAIGRNRSFLFRSSSLAQLDGMRRANLHFVYQPHVYGVLTDIDGKGVYAYSHFAPGSANDDQDPRAVVLQAVGKEFEFEVLSVMEWWHHQSVAQRFRDGRIFLLGDAAHLFCPSGGIGMNTAISDGFDLGWKLHAVLRGWGGPALLQSYERERWPIAMRNTISSANNRDMIDAAFHGMSPQVTEPGPQGEEARAHIHDRIAWVLRNLGGQGPHLGVRYHASPVIVRDGTREPPDDKHHVIQTTWPGTRAPHIFLEPGKSTLDIFDGSGFVLVHTGDDDCDAHPFIELGRRRGIPCRQVNLTGDAARLYERRWVLVRPDGHVCWRGMELPSDPEEVWDIVTGHRMGTSG